MAVLIEDLQKTYPGAVTFKFGDTEALCQLLLSLVRGGAKTATCGALSDYISEPETRPVVGRCDIALNWDGTPALVIRTLKIEELRFCDVTEAMCLAEGENETLEGWREDHADYFRRNGGFDPKMMLLFEHFEMVEDFAKETDS